jgi:hypothetical protein
MADRPRIKYKASRAFDPVGSPRPSEGGNSVFANLAKGVNNFLNLKLEHKRADDKFARAEAEEKQKQAAKLAENQKKISLIKSEHAVKQGFEDAYLDPTADPTALSEVGSRLLNTHFEGADRNDPDVVKTFYDLDSWLNTKLRERQEDRMEHYSDEQSFVYKTQFEGFFEDIPNLAEGVYKGHMNLGDVQSRLLDLLALSQQEDIFGEKVFSEDERLRVTEAGGYLDQVIAGAVFKQFSELPIDDLGGIIESLSSDGDVVSHIGEDFLNLKDVMPDVEVRNKLLTAPLERHLNDRIRAEKTQTDNMAVAAENFVDDTIGDYKSALNENIRKLHGLTTNWVMGDGDGAKFATVLGLTDNLTETRFVGTDAPEVGETMASALRDDTIKLIQQGYTFGGVYTLSIGQEYYGRDHAFVVFHGEDGSSTILPDVMNELGLGDPMGPTDILGKNFYNYLPELQEQGPPELPDQMDHYTIIENVDKLWNSQEMTTARGLSKKDSDAQYKDLLTDSLLDFSLHQALEVGSFGGLSGAATRLRQVLRSNDIFDEEDVASISSRLSSMHKGAITEANDDIFVWASHTFPAFDIILNKARESGSPTEMGRAAYVAQRLGRNVFGDDFKPNIPFGSEVLSELYSEFNSGETVNAANKIQELQSSFGNYSFSLFEDIIKNHPDMKGSGHLVFPALIGVKPEFLGFLGKLEKKPSYDVGRNKMAYGILNDGLLQKTTPNMPPDIRNGLRDFVVHYAAWEAQKQGKDLGDFEGTQQAMQEAVGVLSSAYAPVGDMLISKRRLGNLNTEQRGLLEEWGPELNNVLKVDHKVRQFIVDPMTDSPAPSTSEGDMRFLDYAKFIPVPHGDGGIAFALYNTHREHQGPVQWKIGPGNTILDYQDVILTIDDLKRYKKVSRQSSTFIRSDFRGEAGLPEYRSIPGYQISDTLPELMDRKYVNVDVYTGIPNEDSVGDIVHDVPRPTLIETIERVIPGLDRGSF